jgi:hypothetical protein
VGKTVTLKVGTSAPAWASRLTVTGKVKVISDGTYVLEGPGGNGMVGEMGLTVVLAIGAIRLNMRSIPHFEWDLGFTNRWAWIRRARRWCSCARRRISAPLMRRSRRAFSCGYAGPDLF